ncbi:MAG: PorV/PorQ family protein [Candidatus Eisenbacteria bacterium]|nr:PorV/PorQ family protein [Candidatus Latescibacterota bacterium]MBD3301405.1 PorV/PorQ family protein [Candidatus Eisenbacteria bacterium]
MRGATKNRRSPMRIMVGVLCLLLAIPTLADAAQEFEKVGTIGGQFLKIGVGARATAMGSAFVSVADDATAIYWNPAGIARVYKNVVNVNHTSWLADISFTQAAYVFHVGFLPGTFAVNARSLYMDSQPVRTVFRPEGEGTSFDAGDVAFGVTYARSLTDKFSAGISMNYVQSTLADYEASAYTFDFGTLYDTGYRSLRIGMSMQNLGTRMEFIDDSVKMPATFRVGMSMSVYEDASHRILSAAEFSHPPDNNERANWGVEYGFKEFFFARAGYLFQYDLERFAAGLGFKVPSSLNSEATVDYSYQDMSDLDAVHRVSIDFRF